MDLDVDGQYRCKYSGLWFGGTNLGTDMDSGVWLKIIQISKTRVIKISLNYETSYEKLIRCSTDNID